MRNAEKLRLHAATAYDALSESEGSVLERLGQAQRALTQLAQLAPNAEPLAAELDQAASSITGTTQALQRMAERWLSDPEALEALLTRLDKLDRLKKKYGGTLESGDRAWRLGGRRFESSGECGHLSPQISNRR